MHEWSVSPFFATMTVSGRRNSSCSEETGRAKASSKIKIELKKPADTNLFFA